MAKKKEKGFLLTKKLTHQEIANLAGTTRSTATKVINGLIDSDKIIKKDGYLMLIKDEIWVKKKIN